MRKSRQYAIAMLVALFVHLMLIPDYPAGFSSFTLPIDQFPWGLFLAKLVCTVAVIVFGIKAVRSARKEGKGK